MGCYDTVLVPCPKCGEKYPAQSKSGDCILAEYNFNECPENVMWNVNRHAPFTCEKCGTVFAVAGELDKGTYESIPLTDNDQRYMNKLKEGCK